MPVRTRRSCTRATRAAIRAVRGRMPTGNTSESAMPIISSASLALALAAFFWVTASAAGAAPQGFPTSAARVTVATQEGGRIILPAIEDASIAPGESVSAKELGEAPSVVAIVDTY